MSLSSWSFPCPWRETLISTYCLSTLLSTEAAATTTAPVRSATERVESVKSDHFPKVRGEKSPTKCLKQPPSDRVARWRNFIFFVKRPHQFEGGSIKEKLFIGNFILFCSYDISVTCSKFPNAWKPLGSATLPPTRFCHLLLIYIWKSWPDFGLLKWCSLNDGGCPPSQWLSHEGCCLLKFSEWKNIPEISEGLKIATEKKRWLSISILDKLKGMYDLVAQEAF